MLSQKTLEFKVPPGIQDQKLHITIDQDGFIISARYHISFFDQWIDCTQRIRESDYWSLKIYQAFDDIDWAQESKIHSVTCLGASI